MIQKSQILNNKSTEIVFPRTKNDLNNESKDPIARYIGEGNPNAEPAETETFISDDTDSAEHLCKSDQELAKEIKLAILKEQSIPAADRNVRVFVKDGKATLEGVVFSEQEKMTIGDKAVAFVGFGNVSNHLQVIEKI